MIELLVVLIIIGILSAVAVPQYYKTVETARAQEAQSLVRLVYNAQRMHVINNCSSAANCYSRGLVQVGRTIVDGNYVQDLDSPARPYQYSGAWPVGTCPSGIPDMCSDGSTRVAVAVRRTAGAQGASVAPYNGWSYVMLNNGTLCGCGTDLPLPQGVSACAASVCP